MTHCILQNSPSSWHMHACRYLHSHPQNQPANVCPLFFCFSRLVFLNKVPRVIHCHSFMVTPFIHSFTYVCVYVFIHSFNHSFILQSCKLSVFEFVSDIICILISIIVVVTSIGLQQGHVTCVQACRTTQSKRNGSQLVFVQ